MTSIADGSVDIQTSAESVPSTPSWFGEVVLIAAYLRKYGILSKISEGVRFARRRFGHYEVIDFLVVLFGYAISGERTLEAFYERLQPFATPFMALFDRDQLPSRSALSRFLAALTEAPVEALRTLFLDDLLRRPLSADKQTGGLVDRAGATWVVFDLDGTREAARQRALPQTGDLPPASRRLDDVCAPGYTGRKRGQVVRTRTVISQAHSFQWHMISGIRKIPTYHLICGFDARSLPVFKDSEGQFHISRLVWQPGQWKLPNGTAKGSGGDHPLSHGVPASTGARFCGSTANMAREPCSPTWLASPL
jgi:hypothetical protein